MFKQSEGKLATKEMREFDELSQKAHELTMANARMLVAKRRALNAARAAAPIIHDVVRSRQRTLRKGAKSAKRNLQYH